MSKTVKPLSFFSKVLFSIYPILALIFVFTNFFGNISFELYEKIWTVLAIMMVIFYFSHIRRIIRVNHPEKSNYILFSLLLFPYTLYYIWTLDDLAFEE